MESVSEVKEVEPVEVVKSEGTEYLKNPKARLYAGQIICSTNYNSFTQDQRIFWQKAYRAFRQGKFYFVHKGQQFIVPFKLADDTFNSVETVSQISQKIEEGKKLKEAVDSANAEKKENEVSTEINV